MEPREEEEQQNEKLLTELLESKQYTKLRQAAADMQAADIAAIMDDMEDEDSLKIFRILPKSMAADVFANLELDDQQYIISSLSDKEAGVIIDNLYAPGATATITVNGTSGTKVTSTNGVVNIASEKYRDNSHYPQ